VFQNPSLYFSQLHEYFPTFVSSGDIQTYATQSKAPGPVAGVTTGPDALICATQYLDEASCTQS